MLARTLSSVIALAWAGAAVAQVTAPPVSDTSTAQETNQAEDQKASSAEGGLREIVVTAQRRATNIQKTALAISAYDEGKIKDTGLRDLVDVARITPGVSFISAIANSNFISIRGAVTGLVAPGTDQAASLFLDDVYIAGTSGLNRAVFDLSRLEVLRGPQGTLFGRNVTGGAILLYTRKPQFDFDESARVTYGSNNRAEAAAYVTGPLSEKVAALISADYGHYDGDYQNVTRGGRDERADNFKIRGSLLAKPTDNLSLQLTGYYSNEKGGHAALFNTIGNINGNPATASLLSPAVDRGEGKATITAFDGTHKANEYMVVGRADWETSLGAVTSISAYRQRTLNIANDGSFTSRVTFPAFSELYDRTFTQEVRIASPAEDRLRYVAGVFYLDQQGRADTTVKASIIPGSFLTTNLVPTAFSPVAAPGCAGVAPSFFLCNFQTVFRADGTGGPNDYSIITNQSVHTDSIAAFGELTYDVTDRLSLVLGGRYTVDHRNGTTVKSPGSGTINNPEINNILPLLGVKQLYYPGFSVDFAKTWRDFTPKVGLTYKPTDKILIFATYSEGFRSGGFSTEGLTPALAAKPLEPEKAKNLEVGIKSRFFDNRVQLNASAFHVKYYNLQSRFFDNVTNAYISNNVGDVKVYGLEIEALSQVTDHFLVGVNYAYTDGKVTRDAQPAVPNSSATVQDESLPVLGAKPVGVPPHRVTLFTTFELPLKNQGLIRFNADATFSSKLYFQRNNSDPTFIRNLSNNKGTVNANVSYTTPDQHLEFKAFVSNLTNTRYLLAGSAELTSLLETKAEIASGTGIFGTVYNPPRTFGGSITYRFK